MKSSLSHLQLNVSDATKALPFYRGLFAYFEYQTIDESDMHIGVSNGGVDFWIMQTESPYISHSYHRKATGVNHFSFNVGSKENVDLFYEQFLKPRNIYPLYDSPKLFPEYSPGYYALFFEGPDRIKIEVVGK